jgi:hypothetical protein
MPGVYFGYNVDIAVFKNKTPPDLSIVERLGGTGTANVKTLF